MTNLDVLSPALLNTVKVEQKDLFKGFQFTSDNSHAIVSTLETGEKIVVNHVTDKYDLMKNEDVLIPVLNVLEKKYPNLEVSMRHEAYKRFFVDFNCVPSGNLKKLGDTIMNFRFRSSYDSRFKWNIEGGLKELVCLNGMTIPVKGMNFNQTIKHVTREGNSVFNIDSILEMIDNYIANFGSVLEVREEMQSTSITKVDKDLETALNSLVDGTIYPKRQIGQAMDRIATEQKILNVSDVSFWLAFNGLNYVLNHDRSFAMVEHVRREVDSKVFNNFEKALVEVS